MNKVILIGGNHHNGLGLVRSFGVNQISPYGIIVGDDAEKSFVRLSRYWTKTWAVKNEEEAIDLLLREFSDEKEKPVIIPWSDGAAEAIDENLDKLKDKYIVPSLGGKQGAIVELMDKQEQVEFAKKYDLPMAKSYVVDLDDIHLPDFMKYPCIVKPVVSAEGEKKDIRKCDTKEDTLGYLVELQKIGYHRFLIQEYISCDFEFEFCGSVNNFERAYTITKDTRIWPKIGGTNSFFESIVDDNIDETCNKLLDSLSYAGFSGCFDIEMFYSHGKILLNEINWRNTGNSFFALGSGVHYAVVWYCSVIGKEIPINLQRRCVDNGICAMNEATDLRHVVYGDLPLSQWNKDRKRASSFALWFAPDLRPTFRQYGHLILELIRRGRNG